MASYAALQNGEVFPLQWLVSEENCKKYVAILLEARTSFAVTTEDDRFLVLYLSEASMRALEQGVTLATRDASGPVGL